MSDLHQPALSAGAVSRIAGIAHSTLNGWVHHGWMPAGECKAGSTRLYSVADLAMITLAAFWGPTKVFEAAATLGGVSKIISPVGDVQPRWLVLRDNDEPKLFDDGDDARLVVCLSGFNPARLVDLHGLLRDVRSALLREETRTAQVISSEQEARVREIILPAIPTAPDARLPDLSSLSEEQRSAVAYMAQREAASLVRRVLEGANERIAAAVASGTVMIPIFHLEEVARIEANWSAGKAIHVSGEVA